MRSLLVVVMCCASLPLIAQQTTIPDAPQPTPTFVEQDARWNAVEQLPPGESVELRDRATRVRTECTIAYVNEFTVACDLDAPYGSPRRVVYPRPRIDTVWLVRWVHAPSRKAMLIGTGIGALLGGLIMSQDGAGPAAIGIGLGGLVGLGCSNSGDPFHQRVSKRLHRIYQAS